jgi:adenylate/nucleoside-diphosphate kinase
MVAEKKEKLVAQHGADMAKLDEYTEAFKAANVDVLVVDC